MQEYICKYQDECPLFRRRRYLLCKMDCKQRQEFLNGTRPLF